jgi:hypothetical protein
MLYVLPPSGVPSLFRRIFFVVSEEVWVEGKRFRSLQE